nr:MAG TPA: hypothetical protein [Caudoviricetes sp.]
MRGRDSRRRRKRDNRNKRKQSFFITGKAKRNFKPVKRKSNLCRDRLHEPAFNLLRR